MADVDTNDSYFDHSSASSSDKNTKTFTKRQKTSTAVDLTRKAKLSTMKVSKICDILSESGVSVPNPSQSGIYKRLMKTGQKLKIKYKNSLNQKDWSLHFDGKITQHKEYQVIVLKNSNEEIKLSVLK